MTRPDAVDLAQDALFEHAWRWAEDLAAAVALAVPVASGAAASASTETKPQHRNAACHSIGGSARVLESPTGVTRPSDSIE